MCFSIQINRNIKSIANPFQASADKDYFEYIIKLAEDVPKQFKIPSEDNRVFPTYFCPVLLNTSRGNIITPMRYRLTPSFSQTLNYSSKNKKILPTYNARIDSLKTRKSWKNIFHKNKIIVPLTGFFEFVSRDNQKKLICFKSLEKKILYAAGIWDSWQSELYPKSIYSFAILTTEPTEQILSEGHDRSPVFLSFENAQEWMTKPMNQNESILFLENCRERDTFEVIKCHSL